ncbi:hypothetical protein AB0425_23840 [Actinosynnema sp. NPDC051121]
MLLTRRQLFRACGVAALLPGAAEEGWFGWLRAHRQHVAVVLDDGRGGRVSHRAHEPQPLTWAVEHLAAYAGGDGKVRVGEWEQYYLGLDGGAHQAALRALGIPFSNGVTADEPWRFVTPDDLVAVMVEHGDNAAADVLRSRLGLDVPEILAEGLRLVLGRQVSVARYLEDPRVRLEVIGRLPDAPKGGVWARGTAAGVSRAYRALAGVALAERGRAVAAGVVTVGCGVRWEDGRVGSAAVLAREVDEAWSTRVGELARLVRTALAEPAVLREFHVSLS